MLAEYLRGEGHDVLLTREPGGTDIGDQIRRILMSLENKEMTPQAEFLLFSASRAQHVREVIEPHLEQGGVVICDRFYDSSLAYQGYGHQLNLPALRKVTQFATGGMRPDITLLLDLPIEEGLHRREQGGSWNRLDAYDLEFHRRVRQGYLALAAAEPGRWHIIDASVQEVQVQTQIRRAIDIRLRGG